MRNIIESPTFLRGALHHVTNVGLAIILALFGDIASAQVAPPSQVELNGFLLGQYSEVPPLVFGKPIREIKGSDGWFYQAYQIDKRGTYMVFGFSPEDKKRIRSLQITGTRGSAMHTFLGVSLGDEMAVLTKALGSPSSVEHEKDLPVDLYKYADRNYTVEVDKDKRVYSIRVEGNDGLSDKPSERADDPFSRFKDAVKRRDREVLLGMVSGELEIYDGQTTVSFRNAARTEIADIQSSVGKRLLGEHHSVYATLVRERAPEDGQLRIYGKGRSVNRVYKFPTSKILKEIVFTFDAGEWRVWEIAMRPAVNLQ